jgi:hypothetical protein
MSTSRFLIPVGQKVVPIIKCDASEIKAMLGTQNVMFIHLTNDLMLGVDYSSGVPCTETNRNAVATEIYRQHIKDGIVYGPCVLIPKADFPEPV